MIAQMRRSWNAATVSVVAAAAILLAAILPAACERASPATAPKAGGPGGARHRLVVLSPALAVTLGDLGLRDRIVGRHAYDLVLDPSIPVCGDQAGIDYEALLAAGPTHVIIEWGSRDLPARLDELAGPNGWDVMPFGTLLTLGEIRASTERLGRTFVAPGRQREVEALLARLDSAWSRRGDFAPAGGVMILMGVSPVFAALGPGSFHQQVLERIGGVPAIARGAPYMELDAEDVLRRAPGTIVLVSPAPAGKQRGARAVEGAELAERLGALSSLDIPAVRDGRVWLIDDPLCLLPGTNMAGFADDLERGLRRFSAGP